MPNPSKSHVGRCLCRTLSCHNIQLVTAVPETKKGKVWMQFSVWRTITTAPFQAWIIYWYLGVDYHQRPGRDTCQTNAILRRIDSSRSACIGRVQRFYVQSSGKSWAPMIAPTRHQKTSNIISATNGKGITSAVSARWGMLGVPVRFMGPNKIGAMVVLGCESQILSKPNYADGEDKHIKL